MVAAKCKASMMLCLCIFCVFPLMSIAQLCAGNLGDPIVNIKFGGDGTPSLPPPGISTFTRGGGCPAPGSFSIASLLFGCGSNTWFLLTGDHTREPGSNYMVVNAQGVSGTIYRDTVTGLCGNTTYQFGAFISNEMRRSACNGQPVLPNLTFTAKSETGQLLGNFNTGGVSLKDERTWEQFGLFFTTTAVPSKVVLEITTVGGPGCGSVFSIDDITLRPCGPIVTASLLGYTTTVVEECEGRTAPFVLDGVTSAGLNDPLTIWQQSRDTGKTWFDIPGATDSRYVIPATADNGVNLYRMAIAERVNFSSTKCRTFSNSIWINLHPKPAHQPTANLVGCLNKDLILRVPTPAKRYSWSGPNGFQADVTSTAIIPNVQLQDAGLYTVLLESDYGCTTVDSFNLNVFPSTTIQVTKEYNVCEGQTIQFDARGGNTFQWTPATGLSSATIPNPRLTPGDSTVYMVLTTNSYGCKDSAYVSVNIFRKPVANAGPDINIIRGDTATIKAFVSGTGIQFSWSPVQFMNNPLSITPIVFPPDVIQYTLTARSTVGCPGAEDRVTVKVFDDLYVPNAFTPNGDGLNDVFRILPIEGYTLSRLSIYNRWGKKIFNTTDPNIGWDGNINQKLQEPGTYIYYLDWTSPAGKSLVKKGTMQLIR